MADLQRLGFDDDTTEAMSLAARQGVSAIIRAEIGQMKTLYTGIDISLDQSAEMMDMVMSSARARLAELLGGQDPVRLFVTLVSQGLDKVNNEITQLTQMGVLATNAQERAEAIIGFTDSAQASIDAIQVPTFRIPMEGSGGILDAAAELLQEEVVNRLTRQARALVDEAKEMASEPIAVVRGSAEEIAEFSIILQETATSAVVALQERIASFSAAFARCNSLEDIVNVMISQIFQALGMGEGFTVEDVRQGWRSIGPMLDEADEWAASLANPAPGEE